MDSNASREDEYYYAMATKAKRNLGFDASSTVAELSSAKAGVGEELFPSEVESKQSIQEDRELVVGASSPVGAASPQYKRPWKSSRPSSLPPCFSRKTAVSLTSRFSEDASSLESSEKTSSRSQGDGDENPQSTQEEAGSWDGGRQDSAEGTQGRAEGGSASCAALTRVTLLSDARSQNFVHSAISRIVLAGTAEAPCVKESSLMNPLPEGGQGGSGQGYWREDNSLAPGQHSSWGPVSGSPSGLAHPEEWEEDPVFQGMDYVGCAHQYTQEHYACFLKNCCKRVQEDSRTLAETDSL